MVKMLLILNFTIFLFLFQCKPSNESPGKTFLEKGKEIALESKAELGKNLMDAIKTKGTEGAIEFCNQNAISLTNTLSQKFSVKIKRVSDKARNPLNEANPEEIKIIENFKLLIQKKEQLKPVLIENNEVQIGYFPIDTNKMCLQCHGDKQKDITKNVYLKIQVLYPQDKATGYGENQIRGMWVIESAVRH